MASNCFRIESSSLLGFANVITSADSTERATTLDLYDIYEIGIVFLDMLMRSTILLNCEDRSILLLNAALLYSTTRSVSKSNFVTDIEAMLLCAYLMILSRRLKCFDKSCSNIDRVTCAI